MSQREWPRMTLAAGPVEVTQETLRALNRPVIYHYDPAFLDLFEETCGLLKQVFRTDYDVVIFGEQDFHAAFSCDHKWSSRLSWATCVSSWVAVSTAPLSTPMRPMDSSE